MSGGPPAPYEAPRRFAPRRVLAGELPALVQECVSLFGAAPLRLSGLYLLIFMPLVFVVGLPYVGRPLDGAMAGVGYAGFYVALESARQRREATLRDLAAPWKLPADKLLVLAASGLLPIVLVLLAWWLDLGDETLDALLSGSGVSPPTALRADIVSTAVSELVSMPLLFLQPASVLFSWSGSRTLSATLMLWLANWRWSLGLALLRVVATVVLIYLAAADATAATAAGGPSSGSAVGTVFLLACGLALDLASDVFALVLLQRSLR